MRCIGRTQLGARCKNDARLITCARHGWQPLTAGITSLAITAGLFQDLAKPIYERLTQPARPSTSWYVGSWQIDIDRTLASIPADAEIPTDQLDVVRSLFGQARVEIGPTSGRILGPSGFYSREQRGADVKEKEVLSVIDFLVAPRSDDFAVPTLVQPIGTKIANGASTMSGIRRTSDGIFIEGDGVTRRESTLGGNGTQRHTERAYVMRMYLVRTPALAAPSSMPDQ